MTAPDPELAPDPHEVDPEQARAAAVDRLTDSTPVVFDQPPDAVEDAE